MSKTSTKQPYFLLDAVERVDDERLQSLLGLAVRHQDLYKPLIGEHAPDPRDSVKARDATKNLYPDNPVEGFNVDVILNTTRSKKARLLLEKLVAGSIESKRSREELLRAAYVRRISMHNARKKILELLKPASEQPSAEQPTHEQPGPAQPVSVPTSAGNSSGGGIFSNMIQWSTRTYQEVTGTTPEALQSAQDAQAAKMEEARIEYRREVLKLLAERRKLGIIISFITCTEMEKVVKNGKHKEASFEGGTGPQEVTGMPFEAQAGVGFAASRDVATRGSYEGEYLIACSYLHLTCDKKPPGMSMPLLGGKLNVSYTSKEKGDAHDHDYNDLDYELGNEMIWYLGDQPMEGNSEAPLGGGEDEDGGDGIDGHENGGDDDLAIILLHPHDRIGENTDDNAVDEHEEELEEGEKEEQES